MIKYDGFLNNFDFKLIEENSFKEDSVREEIITPLLRNFGFSASGKNKIFRSKGLKHPYVYIGTKKYPINIIPDYLLITKKDVKLILDAKRPTEDIVKGKNVEQAYSYAIHKEIRAYFYCLCNGKEFSIFHVNSYEPVLFFTLHKLEENWTELNKYLNPNFLDKPHLFNFKPDFGLYLLRNIGIYKALSKPIYYFIKKLHFIAKVKENLYSITETFSFDEIDFAVTIDFDKVLYKKLLNLAPVKTRTLIEDGLSQQPYYLNLDKNPEIFGFIIMAIPSTDIYKNKDESYNPLRGLDIIEYEENLANYES